MDIKQSRKDQQEDLLSETGDSLYRRLSKRCSFSIWGKDHNDYNTVVDTIHSKWFPFQCLQIFRTVALILMIAITSLYFYIFIKKAAPQYQFWALFVTTMAFWTLFVGAGRQKCYQEKLLYPEKYNSKVTYDDKAEKQETWIWGVMFFS